MKVAFGTAAALPRTDHGTRFTRSVQVRYQKRASLGAVIALTREAGKNEKLGSAARSALAGVSTVELPCVETIEQISGCSELVTALESGLASWVVVSSPESARIVLSAWDLAGRPVLNRVASIGGGTSAVLEAGSLEVNFEPSRSTFATLAAELPLETTGDLVLYPASVKASQANVSALESRGFSVRRVNTYTTETASWSAADRTRASSVDVATFASPTTVRGWVANAGLDSTLRVACIGETSAEAARKAGFRSVYYPERPGIQGWVEAISRAARGAAN